MKRIILLLMFCSTSLFSQFQVWDTKNLEVDHYRNGDTIPQVTDSKQWANLTTGAWCYYNNDSTTGAVYGKLYNWYALNDPRGLAPNGWNLPVDTDYTEQDSFSGGSMKETGTKHWLSPNEGATNSSGFTALPGGYRYYDGNFSNIGYEGNWWTITEADNSCAWSRTLYCVWAGIDRGCHNKGFGFSVRCYKYY